jgi:signal transduction histidine kinase/HAMP domain-containing protein
VIRSVKNWLTLLFLVVVALDVALAYAYVVPRLESRLVNDKLRELRGSSTLVFGTLQSSLSANAFTGKLNFSPADLTAKINIIADSTGSRIVVIDASDYTVAADSNPASSLDLGEFPMVASSIGSGQISVGRVSVAEHDYAAAAVPITSSLTGGRPIAVVLVTAPLTEAHRAVTAVERQMLVAGVLLLGFTIVVGYIASYLIARRLKRIEHGAATIADGDFSSPVATGPRDEIGQLAATFNTMGRRLREAFSQIATEKENVEVLLTDLAEGVIGVTRDACVAVANPAAARLLGRAVKADTPLTEVVPRDVAEAFEEMLADGEDRSVFFLSGAQTLEASVYLTAGRGEIEGLIVVRDVTEQARLERARRDFIATASHELKTPLFSLSGFMELLDEGDLDPETEREFLTTMRQQVDRLTELSLSLLDLSQVDSGAVHLEPTELDLRTVADAMAAEFRPRAEARDVTIAVDGAESQPIVCDERRLDQVLRELLENAVKFSPDGGGVTVSVSGDGDAATVSVADQGPGIPKAELDRIFERFFRGREGAERPGTGLGLSIAKELVELLGGSLTVLSQPGSGSTFSISLPIGD